MTQKDIDEKINGIDYLSDKKVLKLLLKVLIYAGNVTLDVSP